LIRDSKHCLILLLQLIEALLCPLLLLCCRSSASEHFVKESHDVFLSVIGNCAGCEPVACARRRNSQLIKQRQANFFNVETGGGIMNEPDGDCTLATSLPACFSCG